jgi:Tfp pilus assembly protein PilN
MISINLRPGAKRATTGSPLAGMGERLKGMGAAVKDPTRAAAAILAAVVVLGAIWGFIGTSIQSSRLRPELDAAQQEYTQFRTLLGQIRREERIRDSVVTELITLRQVDQDRLIWPHIMEDVTRALPPGTWLTAIGSVTLTSGETLIDSLGNVMRPPLVVELNGRTMDIQGFTRFMRQLEDSPWLAQVTAISATTLIESNRQVTAFVVRANFVEADPVYIRRVPVAQTMVGSRGGQP